MGVDILSPSRDGLTLEKGHDHCLSFYYYLGDGAEIEAQMSFEVGVSDVWTRKTTDLTGQWLRGEATLYSYDEDFVVSNDLDTGNSGLESLATDSPLSLLLTFAIGLPQLIYI